MGGKDEPGDYNMDGGKAFGVRVDGMRGKLGW